MSGAELLVVAGEASGDLHGARLLRQLSDLVPGLSAYGLGGEELKAAGLEELVSSQEIAVVGIAEALRVLPRARRIFRALLEEVDRRRTTTALLVDFAEFNLRLARQLAERGVRVVYYVSPQVWAWRRGRVRTVGRSVERMLVLFPFEAEFYRQRGVPAIHVGHPLVDEVPQLSHVWDRPHPPGEPMVLALLPGSRRGEVRTLLPILLESARRLAAAHPLTVRLIQAPAVPPALFDEILADVALPVERIRHDRFAALAGSHLALCASGTATLEVGLVGTPLVVVYRVNAFSYLLGRLLVRLPAVSLVNLVLGENAVPELLQSEAEPAAIAAAAGRILADPTAVARMRDSLAGLRARLGERGASRRAAEQVADVLAGVPG